MVVADEASSYAVAVPSAEEREPPADVVNQEEEEEGEGNEGEGGGGEVLFSPASIAAADANLLDRTGKGLYSVLVVENFGIFS